MRRNMISIILVPTILLNHVSDEIVEHKQKLSLVVTQILPFRKSCEKEATGTLGISDALKHKELFSKASKA